MGINELRAQVQKNAEEIEFLKDAIAVLLKKNETLSQRLFAIELKVQNKAKKKAIDKTE